MIATHYYTLKAVPCDYSACVGRAVCYVKPRNGRGKSVCAACRAYYCAGSNVHGPQAIMSWLMTCPGEIQRWNAYPNA